jgi:putative hydrolase of the HAD superfamily
MRNQIKLIAFDADDTLWTNMSLYHEAVKRIKEILGRYVDLTSIPEDVYRIETENISILGYGTKSFIISMIEAAIKTSSQMIHASEIQKIISIGKDLMNSRVELLANAENVINELASNSVLMLLTKGELFEQQGKITRSGLSGYFRYVEIVSEKNEQTYSDILKKYNIAPRNFIMIGNSLKSDIMPVLNIGGNAVYIPHKDTWYHEKMPADFNGKKYYQLDGIDELPDFLIQKFSENR